MTTFLGGRNRLISIVRIKAHYNVPIRLKASLQPGFIDKSSLHLLDILDRSLIVPGTAKPSADAAPEVARVIAWITWQGSIVA